MMNLLIRSRFFPGLSRVKQLDYFTIYACDNLHNHDILLQNADAGRPVIFLAQEGLRV
jgi:hypothetical protein